MKAKLLLLGLMCILAVSAVAGFAQTTNDPNNDENANACFAGGTLAGSCDNMDVDGDGDIDQTDIDWMWKCGYYLIRVEYGIYSPDILDGICLEIPEVIVEEVKEKKKKKKKVEEEEPECSELCET